MDCYSNILEYWHDLLNDKTATTSERLRARGQLEEYKKTLSEKDRQWIENSLGY